MNTPVQRCTVCGGKTFTANPVLWEGLIQAWQLTSEEVAMIDRQQGARCVRCGCSLRALALAKAITSACGRGQGLKKWLLTPSTWLLRVLELNGAGDLARYLHRLPRHLSAQFPDVDMQQLPYADSSFDLVLHSDTLEHVPDPLRGLRECLRVLRPGGWCCFTIPIVTRRLSLNRVGLPPSYHGQATTEKPDYLVHTEFGSDFWELVLDAGFDECRVVTVEFPSAQAIAARKPN
jgi:SAM-dependent methyltransferase